MSVKIDSNSMVLSERAEWVVLDSIVVSHTWEKFTILLASDLPFSQFRATKPLQCLLTCVVWNWSIEQLAVVLWDEIDLLKPRPWDGILSAHIPLLLLRSIHFASPLALISQPCSILSLDLHNQEVICGRAFSNSHRPMLDLVSMDTVAHLSGAVVSHAEQWSNLWAPKDDIDPRGMV